MNTRAAGLLFLGLITGGFAACGGGSGGGEPVVPPPLGSGSSSASTVPSTSAVPSAGVAPSAAVVFQGPMQPVATSTLVADVAAIGIDLKKPPQLAKLEPDKLRKVMKLFTKALGAKCNDCHGEDMAAPTPRKKVAEQMWNEFVVKLATMDGSPVFCDTCHEGRFLQLDRHDKKVVSQWMDDNFVGKLKRKDGKELECATCHGDPPEYKFLDTWRK